MSVILRQIKEEENEEGVDAFVKVRLIGHSFKKNVSVNGLSEVKEENYVSGYITILDKYPNGLEYNTNILKDFVASDIYIDENSKNDPDRKVKQNDFLTFREHVRGLNYANLTPGKIYVANSDENKYGLFKIINDNEEEVSVHYSFFKLAMSIEEQKEKNTFYVEDSCNGYTVKRQDRANSFANFYPSSILGKKLARQIAENHRNILNKMWLKQQTKLK